MTRNIYIYIIYTLTFTVTTCFLVNKKLTFSPNTWCPWNLNCTYSTNALQVPHTRFIRLAGCSKGTRASDVETVDALVVEVDPWSFFLRDAAACKSMAAQTTCNYIIYILYRYTDSMTTIYYIY